MPSGTMGQAMPPVPLLERLPPGGPDPDALFEAFEGWVGDQGLTLYPA